MNLKDKLISKLVQEFTYVDTTPDDDYMKQDGEPTENPTVRDGDEDDNDRFMYFIRSGKFDVIIESNFNVGVSEKIDIERKYLYDGDHFGEIGLIYGLRRTATVKSANYGSLARLTSKSLEEKLAKHFPTITKQFKKYIFKYNDTLRAFLEMEMDKITFFQNLSMITKQELLYNMERKTYDMDDFIFRVGQKIDRLILIQSGVVQLAVTYDRRRGDQRFVIERLTSGAILNHQSFLLELKAETEFICRTQVSCFELSYERFEQIMKNREDLQNAHSELLTNVFQK